MIAFWMGRLLKARNSRHFLHIHTSADTFRRSLGESFTRLIGHASTSPPIAAIYTLSFFPFAMDR